MRRLTNILLLSLLGLFLHSAGWAQTPPINHKPVLVSYSPKLPSRHYPNVAYPFSVRVYDQDGDTLTYSWRLDRVLVQSSRDSNYTMTYADSSKPPHGLSCVFSDPGGMKDSIMWCFDFLSVPEPVYRPLDFRLNVNYPNPFNPSTVISYQLARSCHIKLTIFDLSGRVISTLVNGIQEPGDHSAEWKPTVSSGTYIYRLEAGTYVESRKMLLIK